MSIKRRILLAVLTVTLTGLFAAVSTGLIAIHSANQKDRIVASSLSKMVITEEIVSTIELAEHVLADVLAMTRLQSASSAADVVNRHVETIAEKIELLSENTTSEYLDDQISTLEQAMQTWHAGALNLLGQGNGLSIPTHESHQRNGDALLEIGQQIQETVRHVAIERTIAQSENLKFSVSALMGIGFVLITASFGFALAIASRISSATRAQVSRLCTMAGREDQLDRSIADELLQTKTAVDSLERELDSFKSSVSNVVAKATKGDLSARVEETAAQDDLRRIASLVNEFLETISNTTDETSRFLKAFADGDLSARMVGTYAGVFEDLRENGNKTGEKLADLITEIQATIGEMQHGLDGIRHGATDLSVSTKLQADQLQTASQTIVALAKTVTENAEHAENASKLSKETATVASDGAAVATEAVSEMEEAHSNSSKIADVTSSVDDIAFQTQLLALNAAVEAARVGNAGKGFAVVASEIRSLAVQASAASTDIGGMVETGANSVERGRKSVASTGKALNDIEAAVKGVVTTISDITCASRQQSIAINQVSQTVQGLEDETDKNAKMAADSAAAVDKLSEQADELTALVSYFSVCRVREAKVA